MTGWVGIDFDGTLAEYRTWREHSQTPGEPIPAMVQRLGQLMQAGYEVRIFTARASDPEQKAKVKEWLIFHLGLVLEVTNVKDFGMLALYDDRAIQVRRDNSGELLCEDSERGLLT